MLDDLHWADAASVELLVELIQLVQTAPLFILGATRPERAAPGWQLKEAAGALGPQRYTEVALQPLTDNDSNLLVDSLLTISDLPERLRALILLKAEGNPFFVEEAVRTLIDNGVVARDETGMHWKAVNAGQQIDIPNTLHALLAERIDRLQPDVRQTL